MIANNIEHGSIGVSGSIYCPLHCLYETWISQRHCGHLGNWLCIRCIFWCCWLWVTVLSVSIAAARNRITVVMIVRVYAMWNRSKRILWLLLFIYVPQLIVTLVLEGVYITGKYFSGMSRTNFTCHSNLTHHLLLPFPQSQLSKLWIYLFAMPHQPTHHSSPRYSVHSHDSFWVPRFLSLLLLEHWRIQLTCTRRQSGGSLTGTCNDSWGMALFISLCKCRFSPLPRFHLSLSCSPTHLAVEYLQTN